MEFISTCTFGLCSDLSVWFLRQEYISRSKVFNISLILAGPKVPTAISNFSFHVSEKRNLSTHPAASIHSVSNPALSHKTDQNFCHAMNFFFLSINCWKCTEPEICYKFTKPLSREANYLKYYETRFPIIVTYRHIHHKRRSSYVSYKAS